MVFTCKGYSTYLAFYTDQIILFASVGEDQTVQRIQSDPDLQFLLTVIYKW